MEPCGIWGAFWIVVLQWAMFHTTYRPTEMWSSFRCVCASQGWTAPTLTIPDTEMWSSLKSVCFSRPTWSSVQASWNVSFPLKMCCVYIKQMFILCPLEECGTFSIRSILETSLFTSEWLSGVSRASAWDLIYDVSHTRLHLFSLALLLMPIKAMSQMDDLPCSVLPGIAKDRAANMGVVKFVPPSETCSKATAKLTTTC